MGSEVTQKGVFLEKGGLDRKNGEETVDGGARRSTELIEARLIDRPHLPHLIGRYSRQASVYEIGTGDESITRLRVPSPLPYPPKHR
ncbi:hypothetical protein SKAU_G00077740 [Synaphobranchus kaupii]|uniref:Uncharacterized protein n=1 Tax=Synaphobranchus kaupii TaxID=118154 RepID=A0A9Q1G808_SYNKA|nr:hypothetical protein SKAU_G00077740 [Synaphobranchus kaupii]